MVLQKRLHYGFVGYQVPPTPRAARSARRRGSFGKTNYDNSMCAFDLLATVAGKLLLEKESSPSSSDTFIKKEPHSDDKSSREEDRLEGSLEKKSLVSEFVSQAPILHHSSKEFFHFHNEDHSGFASVVTTSDCSDKVENTINAKSNILLGSFSSKEEVASPTCQESCDYALDNESKEQIKVEPPKTGKALVSTSGDMYSSDVLEVRNQKPPTLVRVESNVKLPLCNEHTQGGSFPVSSRDDVKLVIRDDDENSSRCTKFGTTMKARPSPRVGDRRIRKLLASKYWKVTPKSKEATHYKADSEIKPAYQSRKNFYKRQRSQRDYPFKKRRLYNYCSASNSDGGIHGDNVFSLPRKGFSFDASESSGKVNGGFGISARVAGQPTPFQSRDSNVKLRIKSFKVPELFVEIPETATVGSLKRTVMEAVTAVLGGGLRVGVLLQGKKIRDDNRTLLQTGISHNHDNVLEALGFSLEPNPSQAPSALHHEDCASLLSCDTPQPLKRYPLSPTAVCSVVKSRTIDALSDPPSTTLGNFIESDHDSAPSPPDMSPDKSPMDSRALVAVPAVNAQALSMVPMKKSKRSDAAQRRIRRPFSVSEVEALVQAVEKLGTGRWRDVKLRAFDNAKHRTYVDLKDKWKTLVHTARISPQQRRGEPVPQELLDRVLTAHAYWSQQQAKQQLKQHPETCLLL